MVLAPKMALDEEDNRPRAGISAASPWRRRVPEQPCRLRQSQEQILGGWSEHALENVALNELGLVGSVGQLVLELSSRLLIDRGLAGVGWTGCCGTVRMRGMDGFTTYTLYGGGSCSTSN